MYHYVIDSADIFVNRKGVSLSSFCQQIKFISENFNVPTHQQLHNYLNNDYKDSGDNLCCLTFDDGLKEHLTNVYPVLQRHGLPAYFFVPTSIFHGKVLTVHKIHILIAQFKSSIIDLTVPYLSAAETKLLDSLSMRKVRIAYRWDSMSVASFKYFLNYCLPHERISELVDSLFSKLIGCEKSVSRSLYLNEEDVLFLSQNNIYIGGHSLHHRPLTSPGLDSIHDIQTNIETLTSIIGTPVASFSYPYGKKNTYSSTHISCLKNLSVDLGFCTEVGHDTVDGCKYQIKRFDPKDVFK